MNNNTPNIRHLRAFLAVAECKCISKATDKVFLSQPAITQAISKLEVALETVLFDRKSDGMYLTDTGEVFEQRVRRSMQSILEGFRDALRLGGASDMNRANKLLNLVTTTQLRALVAVTVARNFSVAGRNVGISQSSLHRSSRDLESLLEVDLFEKTSTGISPSKSALALTKATKLGFSEIDQGREEILSLQNIDIGHIRIGSMPLARTSILPISIIGFSETFPDFKVSISDGLYNDLLYHLRHADLDFLIGALRFPPPSDDILQEELFSSDVVIVARADHPYFSMENVEVDYLAESSWVVPRNGAPTRTIFDNFFTGLGYEIPSRIVESSSQLLIRSLLEGSDRMTVISAHQVQRELEEGVLAIVPISITDASRPIGITLRSGWKPTKTQQRFIDILRNNAQHFQP